MVNYLHSLWSLCKGTIFIFVFIIFIKLVHFHSCCRASDLQNRIATQCLQLHGGWGYMLEYPIARAFLDARVQPIYGGSNEIMKELIARNVVADK